MWECKGCPQTPRQLIIRVSDQLQAGELSLIEVTPKEKKAAKARLDTQHKKRRKRDSKKKEKPLRNRQTHRDRRISQG